LFAPFFVAPVRLDVPVGQGANPHVLPVGRNDKGLNLFQNGGVGNFFAGFIGVKKAFAAPLAQVAGAIGGGVNDFYGCCGSHNQGLKIDGRTIRGKEEFMVWEFGSFTFKILRFCGLKSLALCQIDFQYYTFLADLSAFEEFRRFSQHLRKCKAICAHLCVTFAYSCEKRYAFC